MALTRVAQYNSTPTVVGDYQAQNAHLQAFTNQLMTQQFILDSGTAKPVIKQGTYVSHGGSLYVADADTSITGSPSDGSVYIRVSGTTTLTVEFVTNISGYAWNPVYSALTNGSYTLLPYFIVKASTVWTRYNFNQNNQQFGSLASLTVDGNISVGGTVDGHDIDSELDTLNTRVNQGVKTTDSPTFAKLKLSTSTYGSQEIASYDVWVVPAGIYQMVGSSSLRVEIYDGSTWTNYSADVGAVVSDGSNIRIKNTGNVSGTLHYRKFS